MGSERCRTVIAEVDIAISILLGKINLYHVDTNLYLSLSACFLFLSIAHNRYSSVQIFYKRKAKKQVADRVHNNSNFVSRTGEEKVGDTSTPICVMARS